jgi:hypothetical protein
VEVSVLSQDCKYASDMGAGLRERCPYYTTCM